MNYRIPVMNYRIPVEGESKILEDNTALVHYIIKQRFNNTRIEYEDLLQSGLLGLLKAIRTFDESKSKFATYASTCINNEILMAMRCTRNSIIPVSLETEIQTHGNETFTLSDITRDEKLEYFIEDVENQDAIKQVLEVASDPDKVLMSMLLEGEIQSVIASELGISQSCVSRRIQALSKYFKGEKPMKIIPLCTKRKVVELRREGLSFSDICKEVGISYATVKKILAEMENVKVEYIDAASENKSVDLPENSPFLNSHRCVNMPTEYSVVSSPEGFLFLVLPDRTSAKILECPWCQRGGCDV